MIPVGVEGERTGGEGAAEEEEEGEDDEEGGEEEDTEEGTEEKGVLSATLISIEYAPYHPQYSNIIRIYRYR